MESHLDEWKKYTTNLAEISALDFNYDYQIYEKSTDKLGWNVDRHQALLAHEPPGPPQTNGPFVRACRAVERYQFPDPRLIRAVYNPDQPLMGRNMLMKARFLGFTFYFGVRVTAVIDEQRNSPESDPCQVWGYAYRTLKGHFEVGEIRFEVWKNLRNGEVTFHIDAYSRPDRIPNLAYRVGFALFGRSLQRYFARSSIARLQEIANSKRGKAA